MDQLIIDAISDKSIISFYYDGRLRIAEPHVFGIKNNKKSILCWQIRGESSRGNLPEWRRFELAKILSLETISEKFLGKRPFPSGKHSEWDETICIVS